jgi:aspartyl-tRNA(Asn)/glutamyl-tRNA(Gln) amidotransferase subunit A
MLRAGTAALALVTGPRLPAQSSELTDLSLLEASRRIRNRKISPVELTEACLRRIEQLQPVLNAFVTVTAEQALAQARELEEQAARGEWRGPLHGIPIALKDLIDTAGVRTTAASAVFAERVPTESAPVVDRLTKAGAVLLGKLNMDEFAYNFTSETSFFGPIHNPWNTDYIPGGSSGGSAAAVSGRLCFGALGSDTGGSIRQPAALCGIVGLKPSYGLVPTRGVLPLAWSLDHLGPMCRTVTDTAILLEAMAGFDPQEPASVDAPVPGYASKLLGKTADLRLGVPRALFYDNLDSEVEEAVRQATQTLGQLTAGVEEVQLPPIGELPVLMAEAYAYHEPLLADHEAKYHPRTVRNIRVGERVSMPAYVHARRRLDILRHEMRRVFAKVDLLITPTTPWSAIPLDPNRDPDLILLRNAIPMNIYDVPTVSVPCGFTTGGLPIGLQISGPRLSEVRVLAVAHAYEQATDWHKKRPPI